MKKTGSQIEQDIYQLMTTGGLADEIKGSIYRAGLRPVDSANEDAVISFVTGLDGQIQTGAVSINIYVPNIDIGTDTLVKDIARCTELEAFMAKLVESQIPGEYRFSLGAMIKTYEATDISQHYVHTKLKFQLLTI